MPYRPRHPRLSRLLYRAHSCPWRIQNIRCAGGDYCPFPPGQAQLCCFVCPRLDDCPDRSGVCERLKEERQPRDRGQ